MPNQTTAEFPDHAVIGNYFNGVAGFDSSFKTEIYWCDSYDPAQGYWLTSLTDPAHRMNVSERAIDRNYHTVCIFDPARPDIMTCTWGRLVEDEVKLITDHISLTGATPLLLRS